MDINEFKSDLMDMYGSIDRKWKMDGNKLMRLDGEDTELYFYDLPDFTTPGFRAWFRGLRTFNLVVNKQPLPLNLYERWKLYRLIELKFDGIKRLNTVKKKMIKRAKAASPISTLKNVKNLFFDEEKEEEYVPTYMRTKSSGNCNPSPPTPPSSRRVGSMSHFQERMEQKLHEQLERQKELEEKDPWYKDSYDAKVKRRAEAMMNASVSKEELFSKRMEKIQRKITDMDKAIKRIHGD